MKFFKLIFSRCLTLFIFLALGQLIAHGAVFIADAFYLALHKWFGDVFPLYSPIGSGKEKYEVFRTVTELISYGVAVYASVYLSILLSNRANEHLISKTDGFYTLPEGFKIYARKFTLSDLLASALVSFFLILPIPFIPDGFFTKDYSFFFVFQKTLFDTLGLAFGALSAAIVTFSLHIIAVFPVMARWRAAWLTGFAR